ncbi:hypothetical protein BO94DRAFT_275352 [Aspergillus sclerotioniger CBS 115572]|uniref:Secreted protein n=1 Tax=Aspergillus sclerotioniger CBS 115572 TaxID=1450535 RepID=A0A317X8B6_9EURO|nr:hypothetical protein BO94DRAFT_275352 [Aspergillus sclerotioniger CBS 115572]PWY94451.1 hypothetical protein BO94DRAFT_275352 [Aspergillus sclerotioniger CBS 115572]
MGALSRSSWPWASLLFVVLGVSVLCKGSKHRLSRCLSSEITHLIYLFQSCIHQRIVPRQGSTGCVENGCKPCKHARDFTRPRARCSSGLESSLASNSHCGRPGQSLLNCYPLSG